MMKSTTHNHVSKIFAALPSDMEFDIYDISKTTSISPELVKSVVSIARRDGFIRTNDNGKYELTDTGIKLFKLGKL